MAPRAILDREFPLEFNRFDSVSFRFLCAAFYFVLRVEKMGESFIFHRPVKKKQKKWEEKDTSTK